MVDNPPLQTDQSIVALLADVDGTLVTKEKVLTERAIEAVKRLRERGVVFCITSGRPPRGLRMFVEPLDLTIAMAAFNDALAARLQDEAAKAFVASWNSLMTVIGSKSAALK